MVIFRVSRAFFPVIDGAARHVWNLSKYQALRGHQVWLFQPHSASLPERVPNITPVRIRLGVLRGGVYRSKLAIACFGALCSRQLLNRARTIRPDVIHVHGDALDALLLGVAARMLRRPLVLTLHGGLNTGFLYRQLAPVMFRSVTRFIVVSAYTQEALLRMGVPRQKISVLSSGIDPQFFRTENRDNGTRGQRDNGTTRRPVSVMSVGRLHPVKGYEYLIQTARILAERNEPVEITVIGDGPERRSLQHTAEGLTNIRFVGQVPPEDVVHRLHTADMFVLASVDLPGQAEGVPTAMLEAMASGLPVICTDSGGIQEVVRHGVHGLVVPQRDPGAMAEAIAKLARDHRLRQEMGTESQRTVGSKDWPKVADEVLAIYEQVLRTP